MPVPKRKTSKQRTNTRFANWKATPPQVGECPQCHEPKSSHRICSHCGYYDGVQKIEVGKKEKS
ncbi:MAG: 50S ribosomal protein L32 [Firmicutes bacterium]|nr:50S ribosomal protein L32 [Bacillota bacterium]